MSELIGISSDDFKKPNFIDKDQSKMNLQNRIDYNIRYIETNIKRVMEFDEIEKIKQVVKKEYEQDTGKIINCDKCDNLGWLKPATPDPNIRFIKCECSRDDLTLHEKTLMLWTSLDIKKETFESFKTNNKNEIEIKNKTLKWVQNLGQLNKPNHLILFGTNGTGKTHLARACVNYLAKKKFTGLYESYQRFSLEIEKFQNQDNYRIEYIEKLMNIPFLIVDDVFNGYQNSEYKSSKFHDILLVRYEAKKPTLITAENMDNMSNQLISRIRDKNLTMYIDFSYIKDKRINKL